MTASLSSEDLAFAGVARQAEMIRSGQVTSRRLVETYLERIERINPEINAYNVVLAEQALAEADAADERHDAGRYTALNGVPLALKDNVDLTGQVTSFGTAAFDEPATTDSEIVRRLRDAGAVILGKTNLPELAICGFTETERWGITRNPWHLGHTPGGSSGGSAAAVAAGLCAAAQASDGAGSIRIPAANCNLFGLKPQRDRVTLAPDTEHWHGMSVYGFLTHSVIDTALLLDVVTAGEGMANAPPPPERPFTGAAGSDPGKLRIAFSTKPVRALAPPRITDEVKGAVASTAELLRSLGHEVVETGPKYGSIGNRIMPRYLGGIRDEAKGVPDYKALEPRTKGFKRLGSATVTKRGLEKAKTSGEAKDRERIGELFEEFDVYVTSPVGEPPVEIGRWEGKGALRTVLSMSRSYPFCPVWNHTGQPAASVPAGFTDDGLPLAVMIVGRPNDEATLLALASQIETARPWAGRRPQI